MSEHAPAASAPIHSPVEMDGRIAEIEAQRSMAQNRCIVLAGRNAELLDLLKIHRAEVERLTTLLNDGPEAVAEAAMPVAPLAAQ
ncbi:hypothetical protein E4V01_24090 [Methylorubrum sp. Q1]|uniref:hypothetical protein n=1 Tax=Methylorubrum sp. Q1 TaxID=2562453 RepID=UPI001075DA89|nr:hypothetical protein [Methylorubrum sp. Q1]TFZ54996.1 hypothetical protein E4V01_24090 [Methylorubrum sp. Q1]